MYSPTTSRTLSMNCGSEESFHVSCTCGFRPNARQIRETAVWFRPVAFAIDRVDQCVSRPGGLCSSVLTITSSTCSSVIFRGCPGRGSSASPSSRAATNRARHLPTICGVTPSLAATSLFAVPSAHASTIFDRSASACALFGRRAQRSRTARSSALRVKGAFGRPALPFPESTKLLTGLMIQDTSLGGHGKLPHARTCQACPEWSGLLAEYVWAERSTCGMAASPRCGRPKMSSTVRSSE